MMPVLENKLKRSRKTEIKVDRLSDLPDSVLLHILSFLECSYAVRTCILSRRWKYLWKHLPSIRFSFNSEDKIAGRLVRRILSLRDDSLALHTLYLQLGNAGPRFLKRLLRYAISHDVQCVRIRIDHYEIGRFPSCIFSCQTVTSLMLGVCRRHSPDTSVLFPVSLNLPALTSLQIEFFAFCAGDNGRAEPLLGCKKLNNLVIRGCTFADAKLLCISSATLSRLEIKRIRTIPGFCEVELSTPNLRSFAFEGVPLLHVSGTTNLSSVEQVHINSCILAPDSRSPSILIDWLEKLTNVQLLTISANNLQVLFLIPGLLDTKLPSLGNLKSLKVNLMPISRKFYCVMSRGPAKVLTTKLKERGFFVPDEIVNFFKTPRQQKLSSQSADHKMLVQLYKQIFT